MVKRLPYFSRVFGNAGSIHLEGTTARRAIEEARKKIASILHATPGEIIFTSGATEANNLAIVGATEIIGHRVTYQKIHIVTSAIEHRSVLEPIKRLEKLGAWVTYLPVRENGIVDPALVKKSLRKNTVLVSIMYANNEIGTIQPIKEISRIIRDYRRNKGQTFAKVWPLYPIFHTDAAQAAGYLPVMMDSLGVDMASFGAHKFYGPKGVGFLYTRKSLGGFISKLLQAQILGGDQEGGMRAGTLNVPGIVGMSVALAEAEKVRVKEVRRLVTLRDYLEAELLKIHGVALNGDCHLRLPNNVNVSFPFIEGEQMVIELDARGIAVSTGSACTTKKVGPSHVISNLEVKLPSALSMLGSLTSKERVMNAVRFSLGRSTTKKDLQYVIKCIKEIIKKQSRLIGSRTSYQW